MILILCSSQKIRIVCSRSGERMMVSLDADVLCFCKDVWLANEWYSNGCSKVCVQNKRSFANRGDDIDSLFRCNSSKKVPLIR